METSLKTVFDKFSLAAQKIWVAQNLGGGGLQLPSPPPARPPMVFQSKGLTVFWKFELHDYS